VFVQPSISFDKFLTFQIEFRQGHSYKYFICWGVVD